MKEYKSNNCKYCGASQVGYYCSNCGQKYQATTLTTKALFLDALDNTLNISKKFFITVKALFSRPHQVVDAYLCGNRKLYINPFRFLLIVGALALLLFISVQPYFKSNVFINEEDKYGIISVLIFTLFTKLFFNKTDLVKCLITIIYIFSFMALIVSPLLFIVAILSENQLYLLPVFMLLMTYITRSFIKIFKQNPFLTVFKIVFIFILTNLIYTNLLLLIRQ